MQRVFCYTPNENNATYCVQCGANIEKAFQQKAEWLAEKQNYDAERQAATEQAVASEQQSELQHLLQKLDEPVNHPFAIYCLREYGTDAVELLIAWVSDDDPDARFGAAHTRTHC